jgi:hypothetical protein
MTTTAQQALIDNAAAMCDEFDLYDMEVLPVYYDIINFLDNQIEKETSPQSDFRRCC